MTIATQAAVVESGGAPFTLAEVELDEPRADEVLVRMTAAGLCHTDLGVASGGLPFPLPGVLGHEGEQIGGRFFGQSSFSRLAIADERSVVKVDASAPLEVIAPLGCGVQTG